MLARLKCLFDRHEPKRSAVQWDGNDFVGHCRHCEKDIRRVRKGLWVERDQIEPDPSETDAA